MGTCWENDGKMIGTWWENDGKMMVNIQYRKMMNKTDGLKFCKHKLMTCSWGKWMLSRFLDSVKKTRMTAWHVHRENTTVQVSKCQTWHVNVAKWCVELVDKVLAVPSWRNQLGDLRMGQNPWLSPWLSCRGISMICLPGVGQCPSKLVNIDIS